MKVASVVPVERPNETRILFQIGTAFANIHRLPIEINACPDETNAHAVKDPTIGFADNTSEAAAIVVDYIVEAACMGNYMQLNLHNGFTGQIADHPSIAYIDDRPEVDEMTRNIERQIARGAITVVEQEGNHGFGARILSADDIILNRLAERQFDTFMQCVLERFYTDPIIDALRNHGPVITTYVRPIGSQTTTTSFADFSDFNVDMVLKSGETAHYTTDDPRQLPDILKETINGHGHWCLRNGGRTHTEPRLMHKAKMHSPFLESVVELAGISQYERRMSPLGDVEMLHRR